LYMGDNNQLKLGVGSSGDPLIDAVSGDLMIKNSDTTIAIVRGTYLQMLDDIRFNAGKGVNFINNTDTATGETVSSSVLDEYEEGDWTPSNSNITVNNVYSARYVKVGKIVHVSFAISFASSLVNRNLGFLQHQPDGNLVAIQILQSPYPHLA